MGQRWLVIDSGLKAGARVPEKASSSTRRSTEQSGTHRPSAQRCARDAFGRLLRFLGRQVEIQNYIDDTGVQVADVVVGFRELEQKTLADVRAIADSTRFDYYCWDLYARSPSGTTRTSERAEDPQRRAARHRARRQRHADMAPSSPIASSAAT
jgi:hypothetical protein